MTFSSLKNLLTSLFVFFSFTVSAQLSGTYTIDSATTTSGTNYQSFTAAVSALTTNGVSGAVTFNVKKELIRSRYPSETSQEQVQLRRLHLKAWEA